MIQFRLIQGMKKAATRGDGAALNAAIPDCNNLVHHMRMARKAFLHPLTVLRFTPVNPLQTAILQTAVKL
jgi:hypothetical protein